MGVLREDQREGERCQTLSHTIQRQPCDLGALDPEVGPRDLDAAIDERAGHPQLPVKLQRASGDGQGTGGGPRLGGLIDDAHGDAEPGQPERQHEPGGARPDDQDRDVGPRTLRAIAIDSHGARSPRVLVRIAIGVGADDAPDRRGAAGVDVGPAGHAEKGRAGDPEHQRLADDRQRLEPRLGGVAAPPADADDEGGEMIHQPPHHAAIQDVERLGRLHLLAHDEACPGGAFRVHHHFDEAVDDREHRRQRGVGALTFAAPRFRRGQRGRHAFAHLIGDVTRRGEIEPLLAAIMVGNRRHRRAGRGRDGARARTFDPIATELIDRGVEKTIINRRNARRSRAMAQV